MPLKCKPNEVFVPQHCRAKSSPRKKSVKAIEKVVMVEYIEKIEKKQSKTPEGDVIKGNKVSAMLEELHDMVSRLPGYMADVVHGMRKKRKEIEDVHKRYAAVIAGLPQFAGIDIKYDVFRILREG
jgi:hypothetical protein